MAVTAYRVVRDIFRLPDRRILLLILCVGLLHGLLYVFLVPPWQHYDEPAHFEYAWVKARCTKKPIESCIDQDMRDRVIASMVESRFFYKIAGSPASDPAFQPSWIFIPQFPDPPLYQLIVGIPIRLFPDANVVTLMVLMRLTTMVFLLVTIWAAWGSAQELAPPGHFLRWSIPLFLALLPGFVDIMTAINNDALAITLFSLFFWFSLRLIRRGFNIPDLLALIIFAVLSFFTKKTIWTIFLFLPVAFLLSAFPLKYRRWVWVLIILFLVAAPFALFSWGDAADWYRFTLQAEKTRLDVDSPDGGSFSALQIELLPGEATSPSLWQNLPLEFADHVRGKSVTIGGWVWASKPVKAAAPGLTYISASRSPLLAQTTDLGPVPSFVSTVVDVPKDADRILVTLAPQIEPAAEPVTVFYTDLFLFEGTCPVNGPPILSGTPDDSVLAWCGGPAANLIRNGNARRASLGLRPAVYQLVDRISPSNEISIVSGMGYLTDMHGNNWYTIGTARKLFTTFWANFGWGQVYLASYTVYRILELITFLLLIGAIIYGIRGGDHLAPGVVHLIGFLVFFVVIGWATAFLAGMYFGGLLERMVFPVARYAYPVAIPTVYLLCAGWSQWSRLLAVRRIQTKYAGELLFVLFLLLLDVYAVYSLIQYFYWS